MTTCPKFSGPNFKIWRKYLKKCVFWKSWKYILRQSKKTHMSCRQMGPISGNTTFTVKLLFWRIFCFREVYLLLFYMLYKKVFLKFSESLQGNAFVGFSFYKIAGLRPTTLLKNNTLWLLPLQFLMQSFLNKVFWVKEWWYALLLKKVMVFKGWIFMVRVALHSPEYFGI